jgi:hypothetical protein
MGGINGLFGAESAAAGGALGWVTMARPPSSRWLALVLALGGLTACPGDPAPAHQPPSLPAVSLAPVPPPSATAARTASAQLSSWDDPIHAELPQIRRLDDVAKHPGKRAEIHGRYEVAPVPGGKRLQAVTLVLADGRRLIHAYRPVKDELHLDGQRVVVVGRAYLDANQPAHVQQVMAPHVEVESLSLHPMASPFEAGRDRVRTPPTLAKGADLAPHRNRWVQVFATVKGAAKDPGGASWGIASLTLPDGSTVALNGVLLSRWSPLVGQAVSTIARVTAPPAPVGLEGTRKVCLGRVDRCGMD